jgi:hypothetical protein
LPASIILALPGLAGAQTTTLSGTVVDNQGGVLPGVTVTVTETSTGRQHVFGTVLAFENQQIGGDVGGADRKGQGAPGEHGIIATDMTTYVPPWKGVGIFPYNLRPGEETLVADRLREILKRRA